MTHEQALAHWLIVGRQPSAQCRIAHRSQVKPARRADHPAGETRLDRRSPKGALELELPDPVAEAAQHREAPVGPPAHARIAAVGQWEDPLRRPLEKLKARGDRSERAGELHPGRPVPDDRDPSALERHRVIPLRRVEHSPGERVDPRDVRLDGVDESACRGDDEVVLRFFAAGGTQPPAPIEPPGLGHLGA